MTNSATTKDDARRGRLLLIGAALLWSLSGVFMKSPPIRDIPIEHRGMILACYRALFAAVGLLPFVNWRRAHLKLRFAPAAISFTLMNLLFVNAFTRTTAGAAVFLQYTSTVWVFVFGWLLFHERMQRGNVISLLCAVAGILWIVLAERDGQHADGNLLALGSGAGYAGVVLSLRWLKHEDSIWVTILNHAVAGVVALPFVLQSGVTLTPLPWALIAGLGLIQMGVPYVLAARGVALLNVQESALLLLLEPILVPCWTWLCWGEAIGWPTLIGGALIVGGLAQRYAIGPNGNALPPPPAETTEQVDH